jgi:thymidylate synthase (FAD)
MTFLVVAPIFVFREFQRHRAGWSYNEESARYRELAPVFYIPAADRKLIQQGRAGKYHFEEGTPDQQRLTESIMRESYQRSYRMYRDMLSNGIAREVARAVLPVGIYSSMYATCNSRSLMHFLSLRTMHENASVPSFPQHEIEMVADQMEELWAKLMPLTHAAFDTHGRRSP